MIWMIFCKTEKETDVEKKCMDTKGRGKGGVMYWEIRVEIYTLLILCVKCTTTENLLCSSGNPPQCSVVTYLGRRFRKEGLYLYA